MQHVTGTTEGRSTARLGAMPAVALPLAARRTQACA